MLKIHLRRWWLLGTAVLLLLSVAAVLPQSGQDEGTIRGAVFLDTNRNGVMDPDEQGVGGVYFTVSAGEYSHQYHTETRSRDEAGNTYATGTYGPIPLPRGNWRVTYHVPEGYVATTATQFDVYVPGSEGNNVAWAYLGLVRGRGTRSTLPQAGLLEQPVLQGLLGLFAVAAVGTIGLGLLARKRA